MAAERETADRLIAAHMSEQIGASFEARIAGVTRVGLFVRLANTGADGFIPAATLGADYFRFDEASRALVGTRTGETFRLGDKVEVKLVEAAPFAGALRFEMLSDRGGAKSRAETSAGRRTARARKQDAAEEGSQTMTQIDLSRSERLDGAARPRARAVRRGFIGALPELRQGAAVSRLSEGRRRLPCLRRGLASSARRRRAALYHDADRRPYRRGGRARG